MGTSKCGIPEISTQATKDPLWFWNPWHTSPYVQTRNGVTTKLIFLKTIKKNNKQECIPVGCVPSAAVTARGGGVGGGRGMSAWGRCLPQCMLGYTPPGRHPPGRLGCVPSTAVTAWWGVCLGGVCQGGFPRGVYPSMD